MTDDIPNDDPRTELARIERQIEDLQQTVRDLRASLNDAGPTDPEDRSLVISQAEEQEAIIAELEQRHRHLREQLGTG
ncbi:hypothetical protein [Nocardioides sediminis]|uniref:hypothetical protein n=1 Tax=Nocardioides sediminis TaxID=433648 RepID=UPI000D30B37C|nr:hypothetical protein [Nocardioides sediminis]